MRVVTSWPDEARTIRADLDPDTRTFRELWRRSEVAGGSDGQDGAWGVHQDVVGVAAEEHLSGP